MPGPPARRRPRRLCGHLGLALAGSGEAVHRAESTGPRDEFGSHSPGGVGWANAGASSASRTCLGKCMQPSPRSPPTRAGFDCIGDVRIARGDEAPRHRTSRELGGFIATTASGKLSLAAYGCRLLASACEECLTRHVRESAAAGQLAGVVSPTGDMLPLVAGIAELVHHPASTSPTGCHVSLFGCKSACRSR
jgi:hypothetical protein